MAAALNPITHFRQLVPNNTTLAGRITHFRFTDASECVFRLNGGAVPCRAPQPLSLQLAEKHGYPGHTVEVTGQLVSEGSKNVLVIATLVLLD